MYFILGNNGILIDFRWRKFYHLTDKPMWIPAPYRGLAPRLISTVELWSEVMDIMEQPIMMSEGFPLTQISGSDGNCVIGFKPRWLYSPGVKRWVYNTPQVKMDWNYSFEPAEDKDGKPI